MKRLLASLIIALAASTAWGANYTLSVDTQTANEEQIIDRVFSGNTLMLTFNFLENGTAATLTEWTNMVFHYSKNRFVSSGTYQVTGTKSGSSATFISTNVMAGADKEWYWSVVADSSNGYKRTWGTGTLIQRYDPAAGNPSPISPSITIDFDNYTESGLISGVTISNSTIIGSGASITNLDHSTANTSASLTTGDDHTQYVLAAGTRAMAGNLDLAGNDLWSSVANLTVNDTLDLQSNPLINILDPAAGNYVADRDYNDARYLMLSGVSPMSGDLNMGGNAVTNGVFAVSGVAVDLTSETTTDLLTINSGRTAIVDRVSVYVLSTYGGPAGVAPYVSLGYSGDTDLLAPMFQSAANDADAVEYISYPAYIPGPDTVTVTVVTNSTAGTHDSVVSIHADYLE